MRTALSIFKDDINSIRKHIFVIIIVLAMGTLPSLYAWINIYANWDPYGNTDGIPVAVSSRDTTGDSANEIIKKLKKDKALGWTPVADAKKAEEGVASGKYYAAFIFEDGFSRDMHDFNNAISHEDPPLTYIINDKKNASATKIIGLAANNLLADINKEYLAIVFKDFYKDAAKLPSIVDGNNAAKTAMEQLVKSRDALKDFNDSIDTLTSTGDTIKSSLSDAENSLNSKKQRTKEKISDAKSAYNQAKDSADEVKAALDGRAKELETALKNLDSDIRALKKATKESERTSLAEKVADKADKALTILENLRYLLPEKPKTTGAKLTAAILDTMISRTGNISKVTHKLPLSKNIDATLSEDITEIKELYKKDLLPGFERIVADIRNAIEQLKPLLTAADGVVEDINPVIESAVSATDGLETALFQLQIVLSPLETKLNNIINKINRADGQDKTKLLLEILGGNPDKYADFFSSLVNVKVEKIYTVQGYGEAMTPFYTMIALWVGAVMLVTLLRTGINRKKFPNAGDVSSFFGRFLLFFVIGQIQAAVVIAGNIFLLGCKPEHPWLMWLAAAVTSMVFVMLIYALTMAFGDVGRAAAVVIMMIQIAGSSGTFPMEVLPPVFTKIYKFFPYPHAIDAMRETISGMYEYDYLIYLAKLLVFFVVAVIIGLFVRRPFAGVKQYMTDRMKETEVF